MTSEPLRFVESTRPVTPVAAAREIHDGLPAGTALLEVIGVAGQFQ
jgi:hypothetical protein